jgi:hypothetical protein
MKTSLFAVLAVLVAAGAAGCTPDSAILGTFSDPQPVVHGTDPDATAIAQGTAVAVEPFMVHEEIEGSSAHPIDELRVDDPTIVSVVRATRQVDIGGGAPAIDENLWVMIGLAPGTTHVRLVNGGSEQGSVLVQVVAQDH